MAASCFGWSSTVGLIVAPTWSGACTARLRVTRPLLERASNWTTDRGAGLALGPFKAMDELKSLGQFAETEGGGNVPSVDL